MVELIFRLIYKDHIQTKPGFLHIYNRYRHIQPKYKVPTALNIFAVQKPFFNTIGCKICRFILLYRLVRASCENNNVEIHIR